MNLEEQTIEEIKQLPPKDLTKAYNFILLLKETKRPGQRKQKKTRPTFEPEKCCPNAKDHYRTILLNTVKTEYELFF